MTKERTFATSLIGRRACLKYADSVKRVERSLYDNPSMPGGRHDDIEYYNSWHNTEVTIVGVYQEQGWFTSEIKVICETSSGQIHRTTIGHLMLLPKSSNGQHTPETDEATATVHETLDHFGE